MLALGLAGEVGELVDMVKKYSYHGHELEFTEAVKELGDVYWYLHNIMNELNIDHEKVMEKNIEKLMKRYPNGFSEADSQRRVDTKEVSLKTEHYFADKVKEYAKHKKETLSEANKPT